MEKNEVVAEKPLRVGAYQLLPVVQYSIKGNVGLGFFYGLKKPLAIIIISPDEAVCFSTEGSAIPMEQIFEYVPGLQDIVVNLKSSA